MVVPDSLTPRGVTSMRAAAWAADPVRLAVAVALVLHVAWLLLLARSGGDLAAQNAWAGFAGRYPDSAYTFSWYGGMHPASYSALSPYVMSVVGVRPTLALAGVLSTGVLAWLLTRSPHVPRPTWPAIAGAVALTGDAVSGRATFALGVLFALPAVAACVALGDASGGRRRAAIRGGMVVAAALATAASPLAGLFLGLIAVALFLSSRRADSLALGLPPSVVVGSSLALFPSVGAQPMDAASTVLPLAVTTAVVVLAPRGWRTVRWTAVVYAVAVLAAWLVPSPVGSNVVRLGLLFGGVAVLAAAASRSVAATGRGSRRSLAVVTAAVVVLTTGWQAGVAGDDFAHAEPRVAEAAGVHQLVAQLEERHAQLGRVEVVPTRDHSEMASLAPFFGLARGWNRQVDVGRNPIFYRPGPLTPGGYHHWLRTWAVRFVAIAHTAPDLGAVTEATVVRSHPVYLRRVWRDPGWTLYAVRGSRPLVDPPARVVAFDPSRLTVRTPVSGTFTIRVLYSPWLALVDTRGDAVTGPSARASCLREASTPRGVARGRIWVVLHAAAPGTYRIAAPYRLPRGSACRSS